MEMSGIATRSIVLFRHRTIKALISQTSEIFRLTCVFICSRMYQSTFAHDLSQMQMALNIYERAARKDRYCKRATLTNIYNNERKINMTEKEEPKKEALSVCKLVLFRLVVNVSHACAAARVNIYKFMQLLRH